MIPYAKLRGLIASKGYTWKHVAIKAGIDESTFSNRMNGKYPFTSDEIISIGKVLRIKKADLCEYFFTQKVVS